MTDMMMDTDRAQDLVELSEDALRMIAGGDNANGDPDG